MFLLLILLLLLHTPCLLLPLIWASKQMASNEELACPITVHIVRNIIHARTIQSQRQALKGKPFVSADGKSTTLVTGVRLSPMLGRDLCPIVSLRLVALTASESKEGTLVTKGDKKTLTDIFAIGQSDAISVPAQQVRKHSGAVPADASSLQLPKSIKKYLAAQ